MSTKKREVKKERNKRYAAKKEEAKKVNKKIQNLMLKMQNSMEKREKESQELDEYYYTLPEDEQKMLTEAIEEVVAREKDVGEKDAPAVKKVLKRLLLLAKKTKRKIRLPVHMGKLIVLANTSIEVYNRKVDESKVEVYTDVEVPLREGDLRIEPMKITGERAFE